ncbi:MAG: PEP-CTERM sorting domain-containing protein [Opitutaceae bacterium]|jgi:hypothetical protein
MKLPPCSLVLFACASLAPCFVGEARSQALLLEYTFNQTGTTVPSSGSVSAPLTFNNAGGAAADLHSSSGGGVSGASGDLAFNNTASSGMGSTGTGGYTTSGTSIGGDLGTLTSFTIQGWFRTADSNALLGSGAKIFNLFNASTTKGIDLAGLADGTLTLNVNGVSAQSPFTTGYYGKDVWVFFAVTYDGTSSVNNVNFYYGTSSGSVTLITGGTKSLNGGSMSVASTALGLGNLAGSNARPFDGSLDNVRLFGAQSGTSGVLTANQLEQYRLGDISNIPEPSTFALLAAGSIFTVAVIRRRRA